MATPITREEFQKLYGYTPKQETPDIETRPAPMPITRAEYRAMYREPQTTGGDFASNVQQLGQAQAQVVESGASTQQRIKERVAAGEISPVKGLFQQFGTGLSTTAKLAYEGAKGAVKMVLPPAAEKSVSDFLSGYQGALAERVREDYDTLKKSTDPRDQAAVQKISEIVNAYKTDETFRTDVDAAGGVLNALFSAPVANVAKDVVGAGAKTVAKVIPEPKAIAETIRNSNRFTATPEVAIANQAKDILKVEEKYQGMRNTNIRQGASAEESRLRIAKSNVLEGTVDDNGLIDTTEAVKSYRAQNIDGYESVVKDILKAEGKTVDPRELRMDLRAGVLESGLEGATLLRALKGIDDHVRGLMARSQDGQTIPLTALQDAKTGEYRAINWQTKPNTATYKKTIARVYKETIENNSDADIKSINKELGKFYTDIERLEALHGKKVEGGRLGKYGAQVTGTVIGAGAGMVGGGLGSAVGGIIGGEVMSRIKGASMAQTFKRGVKGAPNESAILKQAKLSVPDKKVKAPESIPRTPEIAKVEKQIARNVELQKNAIKAKDFTLVAELKEIYVSLVDKLKKLIKEYKDKGIPLGMSIRKTVTPASVAKKSDKEDMALLANVIDDVKSARLNPDTNRVLDKMGLGRATDEELVAFAKEVFDEKDGVATRGVLQRNSDLMSDQNQATNAPTTAQNISDTVDDTGGIVNTHNLADDIAKAKAEGKTFEEFVSSLDGGGKMRSLGIGEGVPLVNKWGWKPMSNKDTPVKLYRATNPDFPELVDGDFLAGSKRRASGFGSNVEEITLPENQLIKTGDDTYIYWTDKTRSQLKAEWDKVK